MRKLLIWGTGAALLLFDKQYKKNYVKYFEIIGYIDNNPKKQGNMLNGKKVYAPMEILDLNWDVILLCTTTRKFQEEMYSYLMELGIEKRKIATFLNYNGFGILRDILIEKYFQYHDEEIKSMISYMETHEPGVFNMEMDRGNETYQLYCDDLDDDPYIMVDGKRLYYPKEYVNISAYPFIDNIYMEQSTDSPHLYLPPNNKIKKDGVIVDAGAREGNFAIQYIELCKKIYIVECERMWCRVLEKTFRPYKNRVQIVNTFLDEKTSDHTSTIDSFIDEPVDFLKMDIEGAEPKALRGAEKCLKQSEAFCSICSYHNKNDEDIIKNILRNFGYKTSTSKGYMFFLWDESFYNELDVRRGVVYAEK